MPIFEV
jgi:hypothetical protein